MAKRRENMLEAFQASTERPASPPGGGEAPPTTPGPTTPVPPRMGAGPGTGEGMTLPLSTLKFLLLQAALLVLVFSIGYLAGQGSEPDRAAETGADAGRVDLDAPRGGSGGSPATASADPVTRPRPEEELAGGGGDEAESTAADRAFQDPRNRQTLVVYTARDSSFGEQAAWRIYEYLAEQGYPVVQPKLWKGEIKVFVGAAPSRKALESLEARVRRDPGPSGTQPFYDLYVDNISRFR